MKKETKDDIQVCSAIFMLISGVAMSVAGFIVPPLGEISNSVLYFCAQCLIYAGSIFGVGIYVRSKFDEINKEISTKLNNEKH